MESHIEKQCKQVLKHLPATADQLKVKTELAHSTLHKRLRLMMGSRVYISDYKYPGGAPVYAAGKDMPSKVRAIHASEEEALARKRAAQRRKTLRKAEVKAQKAKVESASKSSSAWGDLYNAFGSSFPKHRKGSTCQVSV